MALTGCRLFVALNLPNPPTDSSAKVWNAVQSKITEAGGTLAPNLTGATHAVLAHRQLPEFVLAQNIDGLTICGPLWLAATLQAEELLDVNAHALYQPFPGPRLLGAEHLPYRTVCLSGFSAGAERLMAQIVLMSTGIELNMKLNLSENPILVAKDVDDATPRGKVVVARQQNKYVVNLDWAIQSLTTWRVQPFGPFLRNAHVTIVFRPAQQQQQPGGGGGAAAAGAAGGGQSPEGLVEDSEECTERHNFANTYTTHGGDDRTPATKSRDGTVATGGGGNIGSGSVHRLQLNTVERTRPGTASTAPGAGAGALCGGEDAAAAAVGNGSIQRDTSGRPLSQQLRSLDNANDDDDDDDDDQEQRQQQANEEEEEEDVVGEGGRQQAMAQIDGLVNSLFVETQANVAALNVGGFGPLRLMGGRRNGGGRRTAGVTPPQEQRRDADDDGDVDVMPTIERAAAQHQAQEEQEQEQSANDGDTDGGDDGDADAGNQDELSPTPPLSELGLAAAPVIGATLVQDDVDMLEEEHVGNDAAADATADADAGGNVDFPETEEVVFTAEDVMDGDNDQQMEAAADEQDGAADATDNYNNNTEDDDDNDDDNDVFEDARENADSLITNNEQAGGTGTAGTGIVEDVGTANGTSAGGGGTRSSSRRGKATSKSKATSPEVQAPLAERQRSRKQRGPNRAPFSQSSMELSDDKRDGGDGGDGGGNNNDKKAKPRRGRSAKDATTPVAAAADEDDDDRAVEAATTRGTKKKQASTSAISCKGKGKGVKNQAKTSASGGGVTKKTATATAAAAVAKATPKSAKGKTRGSSVATTATTATTTKKPAGQDIGKNKRKAAAAVGDNRGGDGDGDGSARKRRFSRASAVDNDEEKDEDAAGAGAGPSKRAKPTTGATTAAASKGKSKSKGKAGPSAAATKRAATTTKAKESATNEDVKIALSSLHSDQQKAVTTKLKSIGVTCTAGDHAWQSDFTHVVAPGVRRNQKCLAALASGAWLLDLTFIEASVAAGGLVDEVDHEISTASRSASGNVEAGVATHWRHRRTSSGAGAFAGLRFAIGRQMDGPPSREDLCAIISAGDGAIVNISEQADVVVVASEAVANATAAVKRQATVNDALVVAPQYVVEWLTLPRASLDAHILLKSKRNAAVKKAEQARSGGNIPGGGGAQREESPEISCTL